MTGCCPHRGASQGPPARPAPAHLIAMYLLEHSQGRGYEVLSATTGPVAPEFASASYNVSGSELRQPAQHAHAWSFTPSACPSQIESEDASRIQKQFLAMADVVVVELLGHEQEARSMAVDMAKQPVRACTHGRGIEPACP